MNIDFKKCDLLIVIGTSLMVYPFNSLPSMVDPMVPRILINDKIVGEFHFENKNYLNRDILLIGDCQEKIEMLL
jgi:NAD-dependent SIR2 family protein deacetylase